MNQHERHCDSFRRASSETVVHDNRTRSLYLLSFIHVYFPSTSTRGQRRHRHALLNAEPMGSISKQGYSRLPPRPGVTRFHPHAGIAQQSSGAFRAGLRVSEVHKRRVGFCHRLSVSQRYCVCPRMLPSTDLHQPPRVRSSRKHQRRPVLRDTVA